MTSAHRDERLTGTTGREAASTESGARSQRRMAIARCGIRRRRRLRRAPRLGAAPFGLSPITSSLPTSTARPASASSDRRSPSRALRSSDAEHRLDVRNDGLDLDHENDPRRRDARPGGRPSHVPRGSRTSPRRRSPSRAHVKLLRPYLDEAGVFGVEQPIERLAVPAEAQVGAGVERVSRPAPASRQGCYHARPVSIRATIARLTPAASARSCCRHRRRIGGRGCRARTERDPSSDRCAATLIRRFAATAERSAAMTIGALRAGPERGATIRPALARRRRSCENLPSP